VSTKTIERVRQRLIEEGLEAAINRAKAKKVKSKRLDGEQEAHLVALAGSEPPNGNARWALRWLADRMVELEYVERLSHETVRQALKKMK
jgi:transposase